MSSWRATGLYLIVAVSPREQTESGLFIPEGGNGQGTVVDSRSYETGYEVLFSMSDLIFHNSLPQGQALLHADSVLAYRRAS